MALSEMEKGWVGRTIDRRDILDNVEPSSPNEGIPYTAPQADIGSQSRLYAFGQRAFQIWLMN